MIQDPFQPHTVRQQVARWVGQVDQVAHGMVQADQAAHGTGQVVGQAALGMGQVGQAAHGTGQVEGQVAQGMGQVGQVAATQGASTVASPGTLLASVPWALSARTVAVRGTLCGIAGSQRCATTATGLGILRGSALSL